MRTDRAAEEEMRLTFNKVFELVSDHSPMLFSDFVGEFVDNQFEYSSQYCSTPYDQRKYEKALEKIDQLQYDIDNLREKIPNE